MAKLTIEEIIAAVKELTVIELNDLVKAAEEEFGVSAAAGVVVAAAGAEGILAAFYAMNMGLPVNKFICASNARKRAALSFF